MLGRNDDLYQRLLFYASASVGVIDARQGFAVFLQSPFKAGHLRCDDLA